MSEEFPHYWICAACALERGGKPFKIRNTLIMDTCKYCNGKKQKGKYITPIRDFKWEKK